MPVKSLVFLVDFPMFNSFYGFCLSLHFLCSGLNFLWIFLCFEFWHLLSFKLFWTFNLLCLALHPLPLFSSFYFWLSAPPWLLAPVSHYFSSLVYLSLCASLFHCRFVLCGFSLVYYLMYFLVFFWSSEFVEIIFFGMPHIPILYMKVGGRGGI